MPTVNSPAPTASGIAPGRATPQDGTQPVIHEGARAPSSASGAAGPGAPPDETDYPEQLHAGAIGVGPNFDQRAGTGDKFAGLFEEAKGKLLHKPELVAHGHDKRTGELKRREREAGDKDDNPFEAQEKELPATPKRSASGLPPGEDAEQPTGDRAARQQAQTVAPPETEQAET